MTAAMEAHPSGGLPDWMGWLAAAGLFTERLWRIVRDYGKDRHDQVAVDADSLFKRAMEMIDALSAENKELRGEVADLRKRIAELESRP